MLFCLALASELEVLLGFERERKCLESKDRRVYPHSSLSFTPSSPLSSPAKQQTI